MTEREIELIENSWDYVLMNTENAGEIFYSTLFTRNPEFRPLFKSGVPEQSRKLIAMISFAVNKLRNMESIISDIEALGKRHVNYRVTADQYPAVGAALIATLKAGLGADWNDETEAAWVKLYGKLSEVMIAAAEKQVQMN